MVLGMLLTNFSDYIKSYAITKTLSLSLLWFTPAMAFGANSAEIRRQFNTINNSSLEVGSKTKGFTSA
jgi:hypothetical protein